MARLYVIAPARGAATAVGSAPVLLSEAMGKVSMDFNPTVDRIRVVAPPPPSHQRPTPTASMVPPVILDYLIVNPDFAKGC